MPDQRSAAPRAAEPDSATNAVPVAGGQRPQPVPVGAATGERRWRLLDATGTAYLSPTPGLFGGHRRGRRYGRLDCPAARRALARGGYLRDRVFFADAATAVAAGYRPCAVCLPAAYREWRATHAMTPAELALAVESAPSVANTGGDDPGATAGVNQVRSPRMTTAFTTDMTGGDAATGVVVGPDGLARTPWALSHPLLTDYYDTEWGMPVRTEQGLFERLSLEVFQSGLSWLTILQKRPALRAAFHDFAPDRVAALTDDELAARMLDPGIIRNRQKLIATRRNAAATIALREAGGLAALIWSFQPAVTPAPRVPAEVPTQSPESVALAAALRRQGFTFVGPVTMHALMEAVGIVDTHLVGSHRRGASGIWP